MRRFLITSDKFTGQVECIYSSADQLLCIDMRQAIMAADVLQAFKKAVPVYVSGFAAAFTAGTTVVEAEFEISLDDFKREYPYSRNYHLLQKRWEKMTKTEQVKAYYAAIDYRKYCERNNWVNPKIADGWLAAKEYLNDWKKL